MKNLNERRICTKTAVSMGVMFMSAMSAFADTTDFSTVVNPIIDLVNSLLNPLLLIVGAVGSLYCVLLGVKYARAEEPQDREKAKAHLKGAIVGFVLIFILIVGLRMLMPIMLAWQAKQVVAK